MVSMDYLLFRGYHLTNLAIGIGFFLKIAPKSILRILKASLNVAYQQLWSKYYCFCVNQIIYNSAWQLYECLSDFIFLLSLYCMDAQFMQVAWCGNLIVNLKLLVIHNISKSIKSNDQVNECPSIHSRHGNKRLSSFFHFSHASSKINQ